MASPTTVPSKDWAARASSKDIPLEEMAEILGAVVQSELASVSVANQAALATAVRLTGNRVDGALHDSIRVALFNGTSGTLIGEWIIPDVEPWLELLASSPGDTLVEGTTALRVVQADGGNALLIGRSGGNRVTIQADGFATAETDFLAKSYGRGWSDGLLGRRLGPLREGHPKDIVFKRRSAAKPPAPVGYVIDSSTGEATPGNDGWVLITAPDPDGTDPLWNAAVHNPVDAATGLYHTTVDDWIIYAVGSTYRQEFTDDRDDPKTWVATPPADTQYLETRIRKDDGTWAYYLVRDDEYKRWDVIFNQTLTGSPTTIMLPEEVDFGQYAFVEFAGRQFIPGSAHPTEPNRRNHFFQADHIYSTAETAPDSGVAHFRTIHLILAETWAAVTQGYTPPSEVTPGATIQVLHIWPFGSGDAQKRIRGFRIEHDYTANNFNLILKARA